VKRRIPRHEKAAIRYCSCRKLPVAIVSLGSTRDSEAERLGLEQADRQDEWSVNERIATQRLEYIGHSIAGVRIYLFGALDLPIEHNMFIATRAGCSDGSYHFLQLPWHLGFYFADPKYFALRLDPRGICFRGLWKSCPQEGGAADGGR